MRFGPRLFLAILVLPAVAAGAQPYSTPRFPESVAERRARVKSVAAEIDRAFTDFAKERHVPGLVWGIVLDGELVHTGAEGFANLERKIPAASDIRFRIASMTKSFTALAILKLRDAGKLALADPVVKHIPEFRAVTPLTADSPAITVWHLLTMTPGFPEDNPWGDRQLAVEGKAFARFIRGGLALSNAPGAAFEYSNLAYALLGEIVTRVARQPYQAYITREILVPLGMKDTRWEFGDVPADKLALGYRRQGDAWQPEPLLHDGVYGAMGGLLTTLDDFARYVSLHLAAWPPRDERDDGPVRRATLREMHKPADAVSLSPGNRNLAGEASPSVHGYGYGLGWMLQARVTNVGHSGGLPGFGSNYRFYPEHGVGIISFANLTYAGTGAPNNRVGLLLLEKAKLPRRTLPPSPILAERTAQIAQLVQTWEPQLAAAIVAENFFLDRSREDWVKRARETLAKAGPIASVGEIVPENQLRGTFPLVGAEGRVDVFFTLTPERTPRLQELRLTFVAAKP